MTSEKPPQRPSNQLPGDGDQIDDLEKRLDTVIARASSLAEDLAGELGTADAESGGTADAVLSVTAPTTQKVEEGLKELDHLVSRTRAEVGVESPSPDRPAVTAAGGRAPGASNYDVPDFMSEFTRPQPAEEPKPSLKIPAIAPEKAAPSPSTMAPASISPPIVPGVPGGKLGVVGTPLRPGVAHSATHRSMVIPSMPAAFTMPSDELPASPTSWSQRVLAVLTSLMSAAVSLLELLNRPFKPVGSAAKQLLGWIAIATIGASLVVLAGEWL